MKKITLSLLALVSLNTFAVAPSSVECFVDGVSLGEKELVVKPTTRLTLEKNAYFPAPHYSVAVDYVANEFTLHYSVGQESKHFSLMLIS